MKKDKRVLYVAHLQSHIRQFHLWYLKHLQQMGFYVAVATRVDNAQELAFLDAVYDIPFERSPLRLSNVKTYRQLRQVMKQGHFDIVHCHTPVAGILTRLGSHGLKQKVFYTAHGFHFFKGAPLINWLVYFPAEWLCSFMTDVLFTMNGEDYKRAKKWFHHPKIAYLHGVGLDISQYSIDGAMVRNDSQLRLISVGELNDNKNHQLVLNAIARINDPRIVYLIAGEGPLKHQYQAFIDQHRLSNQVYLLGFRRDVKELLHDCDCFIFPSKREGLSLALMEAMAAGLPAIVSNIRGNRDLIDDHKGGFVCDLTSNDFEVAIRNILNDRSLKYRYGQYNYEKVKHYSRDIVQSELDQFYVKGDQ